MNTPNSRLLFLRSVALLLLVAAIGCQGRSNSANSQSPAGSVGPEESFALIIETFRRGIEDVAIGFVLPSSEGHTLMTGKNVVSHEFFPPENEDGPYKAIITVGSQSRYSIQRTTQIEAEKEASTDKRNKNLLDDDESDVEVFDADLVVPGPKSRSPRPTTGAAKTDTTVARQTDTQERKYELVYEDGRWELITPLDPDTEQAVMNAFKHALDTQI